MGNSVKTILRKNRILYNIRYFLNAYKAPLSVIFSSRKRLKKYRGRYNNKRCFIIGNGPSLLPDDLDLLKGEYCFAANRIYEMYDKTEWRPTFYCIQDENTLREMPPEKLEYVMSKSSDAFVRMHSYDIIHRIGLENDNVIYIPIFQKKLKHNNAEFNRNLLNYVYDGSTVTYLSIELAVFMGFSKIYLIGVDHNYPYIWTSTGLEVNDLSAASHFYDSSENNIGENAHLRRSFNAELVTQAYEVAEKASRIDGDFKIFNATRGGCLEVFERVDLDQLLQE